ncbi:MAG: bifunctional metallophosphatase/5'-nucleotidase [Kiritimatiellae bacterium]|nr:bifunctional metallophosphatase/5'-nucleotidase [Kiritimatiellia bacterium]
MKRLFTWTLAGGLAAWVAATAGGVAAGAERMLRVLETTDLHGSMTAAPMAERGRTPVAGLDKVATLVAEAREEVPDCLLLDSGDYAQGTLESSYSHGLRMVEAMNLMRYDAVGIGNHEFDWGVDEASATVARFSMPVVSANLLTADARVEEPLFPNVRPYIIKEVGGLRVAIVGLTTPNLPHWVPGFAEVGLRTEDSVATLERLLPEIRQQQPDVMILLVHQGLRTEDDAANQLNAIGEKFPEFDLMLGGHLHWALPGARVGHVDYGQAGAYASGVLVVDLTWDDEAKAVTRKSFRRIPVTSETLPDARLAALFREDVARAEEAYAEVLTTVERPIGTSQVLPALSSMQQLFAQALMTGTGAEAVFHGTFGRERLLPGPMTRADLWRICPHENGVCVAWLTADEIRQIAEEALDFQGTDRYLPLAGLAYDLYPNAAPGERVRNLRAADGTPLNGRRRIPVAFSSYQLAGSGGRYPVLAETLRRPSSRLEVKPATVRDLLEAYLRANDPLDLPSGHEARVFQRERRLWERRANFENALE